MFSNMNWRNLGVRTGSALAAVLILFGAYLAFEWAGIIGLGLILEILVIREGLRLVDFSPLSLWNQRFLSFFVYLLFLSTLFMPQHRFAIWIVFSTLILSGGVWWPTEGNIQRNHAIQSQLLLMALYLGVFPALLLDLLFKYHGALWFISLLVMVFSGDIGAYLSGVTLGKTTVLPHISPKKTWAGAIGGFLATLLSAAAIYKIAELKMPWISWMVMAGLISLVAQSGDFFESLLKRLHNVKDSGRLMPGHGGLLDRIDGLLFAAPIMSVALIYFDPWL